MNRIEDSVISRRNLLVLGGSVSALVVLNRLDSLISPDGQGPLDSVVDKAIEVSGIQNFSENSPIDYVSLQTADSLGLDKRHEPETLKNAGRIISGVILGTCEVIYAWRALSSGVKELDNIEE